VDTQGTLKMYSRCKETEITVLLHVLHVCIYLTSVHYFIPGSSLESCLRFEVAGEQVGWISPKVASVLGRFPSVFRPYGSSITFCSSVDTFESRSVAVDEVLQELRREASFTCLIGWRDEVRQIVTHLHPYSLNISFNLFQCQK